MFPHLQNLSYFCSVILGLVRKEIKNNIRQINLKKMANLDLSKYGISGNFEIVHNPSYEVLFQDEMNPANEGFEKGKW